MSALTSALSRVVDFLLFPFERLPPIAGLAAMACLMAIAALLIVKVTSDQARLAAVRRALQAAMYEIWLFRGDMRAMWRAVGEVARLNARYVRLSLVPALWMVVPSLLVAAHLQGHYGYRGLELGRPALLKMHVTSADHGDAPRVVAASGLHIDTPAVWIPSLQEFDWRIVPDQPGDHDVTVEIGGETATGTVMAVDGSSRNRPVHRAGTLSVTYPRASVAILGYAFHWSIPFLVMMAAFAWMLRRRVGVML